MRNARCSNHKPRCAQPVLAQNYCFNQIEAMNPYAAQPCHVTNRRGKPCTRCRYAMFCCGAVRRVRAHDMRVPNRGGQDKAKCYAQTQPRLDPNHRVVQCVCGACVCSAAHRGRNQVAAAARVWVRCAVKKQRAVCALCSRRSQLIAFTTHMVGCARARVGVAGRWCAVQRVRAAVCGDACA